MSPTTRAVVSTAIAGRIDYIGDLHREAEGLLARAAALLAAAEQEKAIVRDLIRDIREGD